MGRNQACWWGMHCCLSSPLWTVRHCDKHIVMFAVGQITVEEFNEKYMAARKVRIVNCCEFNVSHTHTHTQPFNGPFSGTTRVGQYQKKHSPTHTRPDRRTSFINFLHLLQSTASFLFDLSAWQSFSTTSPQPVSRFSLVSHKSLWKLLIFFCSLLLYSPVIRYDCFLPLVLRHCWQEQRMVGTKPSVLFFLLLGLPA